MTLSDASEAQIRAANPQISTWLSANAGSGKTRVLTDRVARLLLSGVAPQHILCLTYTKAAATEMQNRLFKTLGTWAMMEQAALTKALADLGHEGALQPSALAQARQLFARAIEAPGGLRIQTIHSFCATLLRRFPLEAGVSPAFTEMDDRAARILREQILQDMAEHSATGIIATLAAHYSGDDVQHLLDEITRNADGFDPPLDLPAAQALFGLHANQTTQRLIADVFLGREADLIAQLIPHLKAGLVTDIKLSDALQQLDFQAPNMSLIAQLETVFLFGEKTKNPYGAKVDSLPTKDLRGKIPPDLLAQLQDFMRRIESARPIRIALHAAEKTHALHQFAAVFLPRYRAAKAARGFLDFDDLITRATHLLTDPSVAAWVLFRLDGGIDHILVDEAQDTSPKQWRVIELLSAEMTAGLGARDLQRTLFVVGDKKQSIYSFQGADVAVFDTMRAQFAGKFSAASLPFVPADLRHSFRSSPAILALVDNVFGARFPGAMGDSVAHIAHNAQMPGRVDVWPVIEGGDRLGAIVPTETAAQLTAADAQWQLAQRVAAGIQAMLQSGVQIPHKDGSRAAHAGDFLILVQRRSAAFHLIIRACKQLGLPIAGADRLRLGAEMAVRDLTALLTFLATPEDDLALACALRSPLLGLSEAELFNLAQPRSGFLWEALRGSGHSEILAMLHDLRDQSDYLRPYDLLERALTRHDGRRRLIARLGPEAEEGIDELLSQALGFEAMEIPSLTGFLLWLETDDVTIKRQADSGGALIRVMTVHGAKGLEAPIVILPDMADQTHRDRDEVASLPTGQAVWKPAAQNSPRVISDMRKLRVTKADEERLRLLYVALTRAQSWLIVAAAGKVSDDEAWYNLVRQGMNALGHRPIADGAIRHEFGVWPPDLGPQNIAQAAPVAVLPDWASQMADDAPRPAQPFAPSRLMGAKTAAASEGDSAALARGSAIHLLLEHLPDTPPESWHSMALHLLGAGFDGGILAEAQRVLTAPTLAPIFAGALTEVALTAPTEKGQMMGIIDRLIVDAGRVLAIDFKSNQIVPSRPADVPEGILAQMGAYHAALTQIYPNHRVDMAIVWTKTATMMQLDHEMMRAAFELSAIS
jgi:ATP-dependent helicase/nuclease subunit A